MTIAHQRILSISGCTLLSFAVNSILSGSALAAAPAPTGGLEEIIVTAQRTETSLQQTPISITTFSSEALKERGVSNLLELGAFTPNLQVGSRSGQASTQGGYAIRGIGVNAGGSSPAVGIYVDDVYYPSAAGNLLGLFDIARVEVLRGPQGTLFGRNTIGGALQYISNKPSTKEFSGFVEGTGGNFGRTDVSAAVNIPLGDTVAVRVTGTSTERDGFVHDTLNNVDRGSDDTQQGRLQVRWTPTDKLTIDLKGEALDQESNGRAIGVIGIDANSFLVGLAQRGLPPPFRETRPVDSSVLSTSEYQFPGYNQPDFFDFKYSIGQGTIAYELTDSITLTSITAYSESKRHSAGDFDDTPLSIIGTTTELDRTRLLTEELRLSGRAFSDRLNWTTGVYYYDEDRTQTGNFAYLGLAPPSPQGVDFNLKNEATAVYAQGTYALTDRLSGTLGLRYSSEKVSAKALAQYLNNGVPTGIQPSGSDTYSDTSPHVGLDFQVNPDLMTYVKATKGFRAGGFQFANLPSGLVTFKQETAWTYEIGARMEFLDKRLRINPTIFYTDWKDIQFNALAPGSIIITQNAGDAEIKGGELEMMFAPADRWLLSGSVSYLDGKYTRIDPSVTFITSYPNGSFNPGPAPGPSVQLVDLALGDDMQQSPKTKYTAGARYSLPLANSGRIVSSLNYVWTDTLQSAVTRSNSVKLPSYSLVNAQVQYIAPDNRWSVAAFGTNLTDEYYYIGGINFGTLGPGAIEVDPGHPREYGVTLRFNF